jgi:hypothetical protein
MLPKMRFAQGDSSAAFAGLHRKIFERLGRSSAKPSWLLQGLRGTGIAVGVAMVLASAAFFARVP